MAVVIKKKQCVSCSSDSKNNYFVFLRATRNKMSNCNE